MYTNVSFQRVKKITAHAFLDLESTPLMIRFDSADKGAAISCGEICIHLENVKLAQALVEAINSVVAAHSLPADAGAQLEDA